MASLGAALAFIDATIVNVAFPDIRASFPDTSLAGLSWVLNAYNIVFAAFLVAAGRVADVLGRKRLFQFGVIVFTAASVLCAAAWSVESLIAFRIVQAAGAAIVVPTSLALVLEAFSAERRSHGVAIWTASAAIAAGLGPSLGGVLVELDSWRLAFLVNLPVGIVTFALASSTLVESRAPGRRQVPDLAGAALLALSIASLTLAIVQGEDWGWTSARVLAAFAVAAVLGGLFVRRCTWHRSPMIDLALLRIRSVAVANTLGLVGAAGFYSYTLCNVLFLTSIWGYSVLEAGLALTPGPFVAAAVARPAAALAERVGERGVVAAGGAIWAAGVFYMAEVVGTEPAFVSEWLPGMVILGIGAGITFPVSGGAAVKAVPGGRFATATGLQSVARQLGAVLGVALLVAIVGTPSPADAPAAFDNGWYFATACFAILAALGLALGRIEVPAEESELPERRTLPPRTTRVRDSARGPVAEMRPRPTSPAEMLGAVPLFAQLPEAEREALAREGRTVSLKAGEWLLREGDDADTLYVLAGGRLEVIIGGDVVNVLGPGAVLGELALLAQSTRSASVRARRGSELLEVTRERFERLVADVPAFQTALLRELGRQLQASRALAAPPLPPSTIFALVPLVPEAPLEDVARALDAALGKHGRTKLVDHGEPDPRLLERLEAEYDTALLVAGGSDEWSEFCVREADRVLVLAGPGVPVPADDRLKGCDLLFMAGEPGSMEPWLDALEPRSKHLLETGERLARSVERAARRLTGNAIGVVLSGGGARGFAHIGAVDELLQAGIQIDRIGGASMGGLIGALYASGMATEEVDARIYEEWVRGRPLGDYTLPRQGLIRGERMVALLQRNLPGTIEEMPLDFYCVAVDLLTGQRVVHRRGPAWELIGSSMNLPGLAPPWPYEDMLLVDGGLLDNLPVDVMADAEEGPVIAVDVTGAADESATSGPAETPGLPELMVRSSMISSITAARAARERADMVIRPSPEGVGLLEFHLIDTMVESGRRAAREALADAPPNLLR